MSIDTAPVVDALDELTGWAVALLGELVSIPSVTGDERAAQTRFATVLRDLGLDVDEWCPTIDELRAHPSFSDDELPLDDRPVVVGRWIVDPEAPTLTLNGHMDVVPPGDPAAWTSPAFEARVDGDRLYGRGSCDMKGGLVAAVLAIAALRKAGIDPQVNVLVQSVIGEESGGAGTLAALLRGHVGDAAILLEPTRMDVCPVGAGALTFRLHVHGRAAHGANRLDGTSAIDLFVELNRALAELERARHEGFTHPAFADGFLVAPISIGRLAAGDWPSTVPDGLTAEGRFGVLPGEDPASARVAFERAVAAAASGDAWRDVAPPTVEWFEGQFAPAATPLAASLVDLVGRTHEEVTGRAAVVRGVPYGSDLRFFTNDAGVPGVLYGPGDPSVAHAVDEFVPMEEVRDVAKVLALLLLRPPPPAGYGATTDDTASSTDAASAS